MDASKSDCVKCGQAFLRHRAGAIDTFACPSPGGGFHPEDRFEYRPLTDEEKKAGDRLEANLRMVIAALAAQEEPTDGCE